MPSLSLQFGAMCDPIEKQLNAQGFLFDPKDAKHWQKCADAITLLAIHSYLSDSEKQRAKKRLGMSIARRVRVEGQV